MQGPGTTTAYSWILFGNKEQSWIFGKLLKKLHALETEEHKLVDKTILSQYEVCKLVRYLIPFHLIY